MLATPEATQNIKAMDLNSSRWQSCWQGSHVTPDGNLEDSSIYIMWEHARTGKKDAEQLVHDCHILSSLVLRVGLSELSSRWNCSAVTYPTFHFSPLLIVFSYPRTYMESHGMKIQRGNKHGHKSGFCLLE